MLVDTDIWIDYLRGNPQAQEWIERHVANLFISAVSVAELYQGVRDGKEKSRLAKTLSATTVLPLTEEIAEMAGLYRRDFRPSTGCGLADCMIAATAAYHGLEMATLNARHFKMIESVVTPYEKT